MIFWIALLLLIPLSYLIPSLTFVFRPFLGQTIYIWLILPIILETFLWGAFKLVTKLGPRGTRPFVEVSKEILRRVPSFVGFKRRYAGTEILAGVFVGILLAVSTIIIRSYFENAPIQFTNPLVILYLLFTRYEMWIALLLTPVVEEVIYRGLFINRLVRIVGRKYVSGAFAIISTAFVFGWSHLESPIYKMIAGFALGVIYLWGWRKNIAATTAAHISANLLFFFLTV